MYLQYHNALEFLQLFNVFLLILRPKNMDYAKLRHTQRETYKCDEVYVYVLKTSSCCQPSVQISNI